MPLNSLLRAEGKKQKTEGGLLRHLEGAKNRWGEAPQSC